MEWIKTSWQNSEILKVKAGGKYNYHLAQSDVITWLF
jgi:hypothetical protein